MTEETSDYRAGSQLWAIAALIVWVLLTGYGLANIPAAIDGILFVQVLPALVLGGLGAMGVDLVRLLVHRDSDEARFTGAVLAILGAIVTVTMHNARHKLGLVEENANEHYSKLTEHIDDSQ